MGSLGPVELEIGDEQLEHRVYVAPLQDEMLLGIDFMQKHGVQLHCGAGELRVGGSFSIQPMHKARAGSVQAVSARRVHLPPLSPGVIDCTVQGDLTDFILEPVDKFPPGVLPSRSINPAGKNGKICLINMTSQSHVFKAGQQVAVATPVTEVCSPSVNVRQVGFKRSADVPPHIQPILEDVRTHAPPDVREEAERLLMELYFKGKKRVIWTRCYLQL